MFRLVKTGGPFGDSTYNYNVVTDKLYTVKEFINEILMNKKEWGYVRIGKNFAGKKVCEYRHGSIVFLDESVDMGKTIKSGWANGGWSAMDYFLEVEE